MAKLYTLESLDFTQIIGMADREITFSRSWITTKLQEEGYVQVNTLLYTMGKETEPTFSTFTLDKNSKDDYKEVIKKFSFTLAEWRRVWRHL